MSQDVRLLCSKGANWICEQKLADSHNAKHMDLWTDKLEKIKFWKEKLVRIEEIYA